MGLKKLSRKKMTILSTIIISSLILISVLTVLTPKTYSQELSSFVSYEDFFNYLKEQGINDQSHYYSFSTTPRMMETANGDSLGKTDSGSFDDTSYSETNIQVEGVDEPDSVKTDGTYIYILSDQTIYIIQATPASSAQILSTISLPKDQWYQSFFVNNDRLVVFGESSPNYWYYPEPLLDTADSSDSSDNDDLSNDSTNNIIYEAGNWDVPTVIIEVYDLTDITNPTLQTTIELEGIFVNARMVDSQIYVVASEHTSYLYRTIDEADYFKTPSITIDNIQRNISAEQIYYVDEPDQVDSLTHILSLNIESLSFTQKSFLIGNTKEIYMSINHIYLVYTSYDYTSSVFGTQTYNPGRQTTRIHKIAVDNDEIIHLGSGEVPGRSLNQFSMDEHNGYFRIATTTGYIWNEENPSQNNIYILDEQLSIVSSIEDIATGEEIYSARFMGNKAYLVTFKNVDPFFTLDLSDPYDPQVLGELKIPGYSDYLHPYDEHHIIGIGKDAIASNDPNFAWYQGVKLALFNVSNFNDPVLVDTTIIGDRGSSSPVLYDHKALLFDRERQLLVLPMSVYEIPEEQKQDTDNPSAHGRFSYQGAYVYEITSEGFTLRDRITHLNETDLESISGQYGYYWNTQAFIYRSLYINDILFTISEKMLKANHLETLNEISEVILSV